MKAFELFQVLTKKKTAANFSKEKNSLNSNKYS